MKKLLFFLLICLPLSAQEVSVQKGLVVDSLPVSDTLDESFALYLPTAFQGNRNWPILFIFDGQGRGKTAAELFKPAAEQQGYILASSNDIDIENGLAENVSIATRLLNSVTSMLPVDMNQVSTSGSMTGAQVATSIPVLFEKVHGVIAVGDQWVNFDLLDRKNDFVFIGVVGDEHFTSGGMHFTVDQFRKLDFPSQMYVYQGQSDWPDSEVILSAVGSLTIQSMKTGIRPMDRTLILELYDQDLGRANRLISTNQLIKARDFLELLQDKYDELVDLQPVEQRIDQVRRSRNYTQQRREQDDILEKEARLIQDFIFYLDEDIRTLNFENLGWWNYQKNQLDSLSAKGGAEGKMAERLKGFISKMAQIKRQELQSRNAPLEERLLANMLQTIFDPQDFEAYKQIIALSAQDHDYETAYFYLTEMLKHGYRNKEALYEIEGTLGLRMTETYNQIIEKYFGSARYYDRERENP